MHINRHNLPPSTNAAGRRRRSRRAFTLMEVLLVTVILVVLAGMAGVFLFKAQRQAYTNAANAQIGMFVSALEFYVQDMNYYPADADGLNALIALPQNSRNIGLWKGPYLKANAIPLDPWNNEYQYHLVNEQEQVIQIWSAGPDGIPNTPDDITYTSVAVGAY